MCHRGKGRTPSHVAHNSLIKYYLDANIHTNVGSFYATQKHQLHRF